MNKILLFALLIASTYGCLAQNKLELTLPLAIKMAQANAPESIIARKQLEQKKIQFKQFESRLRPNLSLDVNPFNFNRYISAITLPNGTEAFVPRSFMNSKIALNLSQELPFSGGNIFASSSLNRLEIFDPSSSKSYLSTPINFGINQTLFGFNNTKWDKQTEPLAIVEAEKVYNEEMEAIAIRTIGNFFNLYIAEINKSIAQQNKANSDTIYKISQGRYNLGKIGENELLQIELNRLNANAEVVQSDLNIQKSTFELKNNLGIKAETQLKLEPNFDVPDLNIDVQSAWNEAKQNLSRFSANNLDMHYANREIARVKGNTGIDIDIFASFGLSNSSSTFEGAYNNPQDQEQIGVGVSIPLIDWGNAKNQKNIAQLNYEIVDTRIKKENNEFELLLTKQIQEFNLAAAQFNIAQKANDVANRRYEITIKRYLIGKISISDLTIANQEKDKARRAYVVALRTYWNNYYSVRQNTLYDFVEGRKISYAID